MMARILLAEDDREIANLERDYLEMSGHEVVIAPDGEEAMKRINEEKFDLLILDIMMPKKSGYDICREIREQIDIPILMVTAKTESVDKIRGLGLGADDYISKPFSLREVIARVKAVLRRTATSDTEKAPEQLCYQSLVIDITKKKVSIDGEEVPLTKKEFEILFLLLQNKGRVFSREDILSRIWSDEVYVLDRTIDVNITRLRKKIGTYGKRIVTRLGYGYCFETE